MLVPIAHSAAQTEEPVSEGVVALLEPFIDTLVICSMTGLVIISTGVWSETVPTPLTVSGGDGSYVRIAAHGSMEAVEAADVPATLEIQDGRHGRGGISTAISWSYYGDRCANYLFGAQAILPY